MGNLNGIPINWNTNVEPLLGSLFPGGAQQPEFEGISSNKTVSAYKSPLDESLFYGPQIYDGEEPPPPDTKAKYFVIFIGFDTESELNDCYLGITEIPRGDGAGQKINDFLKAKPNYIICCYVRKQTTGKLLLIRMGTLPFNDYLASDEYTSRTNTASKNIVDIISRRDERDGFDYKPKDVIVSFRNAVPNKRSIPQKKSDSNKSELYENNYKYFMGLAGKDPSKELRDAILLLCSTISKVNQDVFNSYNQQTDVRYNSQVLKQRNLTVSDILSMNRRILSLANKLDRFKKAEFKNAYDLMDFVDTNLVDRSAVSADTNYIISYPFVSLSYEYRVKLLLLFLSNDVFRTSGILKANNGIEIFAMKTPNGILWKDVFLMLLTSVDGAGRLKLINDSAVKPGLFRLIFSTGDSIFLNTLLLISGAAILEGLTSEESQILAFKEAVLSGNFIFYDDAQNKVHNSSRNEKLKKIRLTNEGHKESKEINISSPLNHLMDAESSSFVSKEQEYLAKYASVKQFFDPFELIVFTAESKLSSNILKAIYGKDFTMEKDDFLLLPACIVYMLFEEFNEKEKAFGVLVILTAAFLPIGLASLVIAIEAASVIGIVVATTDIAIDVTVLAVNSPDAIKENEKRAQFVNTLAFFYGLARLPYSLSDFSKIPVKPNGRLIKALEAVKKRLGKLARYEKPYIPLKLKPLISSSQIYKQYGRTGQKLVNIVDKKVMEIFRSFKSKQIEEFSMISGMMYSKGGRSEIAIARNFTQKEIKESQAFNEFLNNMHPILKARYDAHIAARRNGLKALPDDIKRAGIVAAHGEIRALDELLKKVDPLGKMGDKVFDNITGYNRFLRSKTPSMQPPCVNCFYMTDGVKFVGF